MFDSSIAMLVMNNFSNDSRVLKEGVSASTAGFRVKIVALADDDNTLPENDLFEGGTVKRISLRTKKLPKKIFFQLIKYLEYTIKAVSEIHNAKLIHCNDLEPLPVAIISKILSFGKQKILYDAHEFETERHGNVHPLFHTVMVFMEKQCLKFCDAVITVSDGIAEEYQHRYKINKPQVIMNCPYYQEPKVSNKLHEVLGIDKNKKIVLYQGRLSQGRGIEAILAAFFGTRSDEFVLVLMGYGPMQQEIEELSKKHASIFFHPAVSPNDLLAYTASADIGILLYPNTCLNHYYCLPNKFFEYIMSGLPVIVSDLYELARITNQHNLGITVSDYTASKINWAITALMESIKNQKLSRNTNLIAQQYSWEQQEEKLIAIYKTMNGEKV